MDSASRVPAIVPRRGWLASASAAAPRVGAAAVLAAFLSGPFLGRDAPAPDGARSADRFACPLVLDLDGKGIDTSAPTVFDIDGDGRPDRMRDVREGAAILVFDADHDGVSGESGAELLGNAADVDGDGKPDGFSDGFEALLGLAHEAYYRGRIDEPSLRSGRLGPDDLRALEAAFGLRARVGGLRGQDLSLREAGIVGLRLSDAPTTRKADFDGAGNELARRDGAVFLRSDGTPRGYADVWLRYKSALNPGLSAAR